MTEPVARSKTMKNPALAASVIAVIGGFEGVRQSAYPDPATRGAPWTICYGHTGTDVVKGRRESLSACKALLFADIDNEASRIETCLQRPMTDGQAIAFISLAHNIGAGGVCRSELAKDFRAGRIVEACNRLPSYNHVGPIVFPQLNARREKERELCLEDI